MHPLCSLLFLGICAAADQPANPTAGQGLRGEYFADRNFESLGVIRTDSVIDFTWGKNPPYEGGKQPNRWTDNLKQSWSVHFAVRWTGRLVPQYSELYTISVTVDDGALLWIDDKLVINAWKEQGPTEYQGQVKLTAGRPVAIKLLYFNAWFAGSIRLSWSSPSQPKQLIPQKALLLPEPEPKDENPSAIGSVRIRERTIELPKSVTYNPDNRKPSLLLHALPKGGFKLGWTDTAGTAHISAVSNEFQIEGKEVTIPNLDLRGLVVHEDGSMAVMGARLPERMVVRKMSADGDKLFETTLVGDKGRGEGSHFLDEHFSFTGRFGYGGDRYAVHFGHAAHHGKGGVHQGGFYALLDGQGKIAQESNWTVSHSLDQRLLFHRGSFLTLSAGDCYPKGLWFENRSLKLGRVIYPEPDKRDKFGNCAGFVNAKLGSMVSAGGKVALTFLTKDENLHEIVFMLLEEDGRVLKTLKLATSKVDVQAVRLAPFGDQLLLVWQESGKGSKAAVLSHQGKLLTEPTILEAPLTRNDDLVGLSKDAVGWLTAENGKNTVRLVQVIGK